VASLQKQTTINLPWLAIQAPVVHPGCTLHSLQKNKRKTITIIRKTTTTTTKHCSGTAKTKTTINLLLQAKIQMPDIPIPHAPVQNKRNTETTIKHCGGTAKN